MKISVVTISFNQAPFLERTIRSVLEQSYGEFEYIIVDPGSTDGSREIIERYRDRFAQVILEPDRGAADGLNRGFAHATGDVFFYLNSDDTIAPDAFATAIEAFRRRPAVDVLCGDAWIVDGADNRLRRAFSDRFSPRALAHGECIMIQPSTYIRASAFRKAGGFNVDNRSNWDGELIVDLSLSGARIERLPAIVSNYRLHPLSITASGSAKARLDASIRQLSRRILGREPRAYDPLMRTWYRLRRKLVNPRDTAERIQRGPIFMRDARPKRRPLVRRPFGSLIVQFASLPLPWPARRTILRHVLGFEIADSAWIGRSLVVARSVRLEDGAWIGHLNYVKGLSSLHLGEGAILAQLNWVTGFPIDNTRFFSHKTDRDPSLVIEAHAAVTSRHLIDCTDRVTVSAFATFGGWGSQILTHSIDIHQNRQSCQPVRIGRYCFVGTRCVILPGVEIGDYNVVGAGSVVARSVVESRKLISGVPAEIVRDIAGEPAYFSRTVGFVH